MNMKKIIYGFTLCLIIWSHGYMQVISDNQYAFGFKNIFNWNIVFLNKQIDDSEVRMIMFEDISNVKDRIITCEISQIERNKIKEIIESNKTAILDTISNPYGNKPTYIFTEKNNNSRINAFIDHFGYTINVSYFDILGPDKKKFKELINSYTNIKLNI